MTLGPLVFEINPAREQIADPRIEDWIAAGLPIDRPRPVRVRLSDLVVSPTAALLEGRGHWTWGDEVVELEPGQLLVVRPDTPHGFRNVGDVPLLVVSVHECGTLRQTWLGRDPA